MEYKDNEILARTFYSGQKLLELNEKGEVLWDAEPIFEMEHEDGSVTWYEIAGMEHLNTPFTNPKHGFYDSIVDAKKAIDWYEEKHKDDE